jgi:hypothetical protein
MKGLDLLLAALVCLAEPLGLAAAAPAEAGATGCGPEAETDTTAAAAAPKVRHPPGGLGSWPWWAARALMLQQQALAGRSATLQRALLAAGAAAVAWAEGLRAGAGGAGGGKGGGAPCGPEAAALLAAGARLEAARAHQAYGDVEAARRQLEAAASVLGMEVRPGAGGVERGLCSGVICPSLFALAPWGHGGLVL